MIDKLIISVVSAILTAIVTVLLNQMFNDKREHKKEKLNTYNNRPEFDIVNYYNYIGNPGEGIDDSCDINLFVSSIKSVDYDKENDDLKINYFDDDLDRDNWCCVIYELKNAGKTDVPFTHVVCNSPKSHSVFEVEKMNLYFDNNIPCSCVIYDKKIRTGNTLKIKFIFNKQRILDSRVAATFSILLEDVYNHAWQQPLFVAENQIYDSHQINAHDYNAMVRTETNLECFKNPALW